MCGIAGAFNVPDASRIVSMMLTAIQHRGQKSAGIISFDDGCMCKPVRELGLVDEVFRGIDFSTRLPGMNAIGHVRYPTTGSPCEGDNIQPMSASTRHGNVALAYNGNMTNYLKLRRELEAKGSIFRSDCDTEVFHHLMAGSSQSTHARRLCETFGQVEGSYAMLVAADDGTAIAATDPYGFRPLSAIRYKDGYLIASESRAFHMLSLSGRPYEIEPGSIVQYKLPKPTVQKCTPAPYGRRCVFEHVYFAMPDSYMFGSVVHDFRWRAGIALAEESPMKDVIVVPVPDSANPYAESYAEALGLPLRKALIRNHYTGRTFITPGQQTREYGVLTKLNAIEHLVRGQNILLIDDSIVRGTTSTKIVRMLRRAGAKSVHMLIPSPPVAYSCFWGIATHDRSRLMAARHSVSEMGMMLGLDSLRFLPVQRLAAVAGDPEYKMFCYSCFTGELPVKHHARSCEESAGCADT
jgi:amidophosphoribosyltransferase